MSLFKQNNNYHLFLTIILINNYKVKIIKAMKIVFLFYSQSFFIVMNITNTDSDNYKFEFSNFISKVSYTA